MIFRIVAARDAAVEEIKRALESKLEDIVYRTSVTFTDDLDASQLQTLLQMQSDDVRVNVGQLALALKPMTHLKVFCESDFPRKLSDVSRLSG